MALFSVSAVRAGRLALSLACVLALGLSACDDEEVVESEFGPDVPHTAPDESPPQPQMCVACHACGTDGAPTIDRSHQVCTECHGPAPDFVAQVKGDGGCGWRMDCEAKPPEVNCLDACHDHTPRQINGLCERCHAYPAAGATP